MLRTYPEHSPAMTRHQFGTLLVFGSAVAYSSAGFFTRLIVLDPWTMLFWRGVFAGGFIAMVVVIQNGWAAWAALRRAGLPGLAAAGCSAVATILFINAFRRTSVADVVVIFATAPFITAVLGQVWLGVRETRATLLASGLALAGVVIMVGGAAADGRLVGNLLAFGMTVLMSVMMLLIRRHQDTPMLPAAGLSAFLCALLVWPVAAPMAVTRHELLQLALFGVTQFGLGLLLLTAGGRLISAGQTALINTAETPLAVLLVWLAFGEQPAIASLVGGAVVIAAVAGHVWLGARRAAVEA